MTSPGKAVSPFTPNPALDLVLQRVVDVPPSLVWRAWTEPELLKPWFTPKPWSTVDCEIDLRPGGIFKVVMQSPEGQTFAHPGCYLEVVPRERLVWTSALLPGYRPNLIDKDAQGGAFAFTCILTLEPHGTGTKYTATALHGDPATKKTHEEMGFHDGWGTALDQLVAFVRQLG